MALTGVSPAHKILLIMYHECLSQINDSSSSSSSAASRVRCCMRAWQIDSIQNQIVRVVAEATGSGSDDVACSSVTH